MRSNLSRWSLLFLLSLLPVLAHAQFAGGSGTSADPWLIATPEQLDAIRNHSTNHFQLIADIDLGVAPWNEDEGWLPIPGFMGSIDGSGHSIFNLYINRPWLSYCGLFGAMSANPFFKGRVEHLRLENVDIRGNSRTGALAGNANWFDFRNIHVSGRVEGGSLVGGLVGDLIDGSVRNVEVTGVVVSDEGHEVGGIAGFLGGGTRMLDASAHVDVSGRGSVGGAVGRVQGGVNRVWVARVFSHGTVTGFGGVGGFAGVADTVDVHDCYSLAAVTGTSSYVGGFVGWHVSGTIMRGYSTGPVSGPVVGTGGFAGSSQSLSEIRNCYWDVETSGQTTSAGGEGRTTVQMRQQETYGGFNFAVVWEIEEGVSYPTLRDLGALELPQPINLADLAGTGTTEDPYIITTVHELNAMRQSPGSHYRLGNDIDAAATLIWDDGAGWLPVGSFSGSLDGDGFRITNLHIQRPGAMEVGLFARMYGAEVSNLSLVGVYVQGGREVGGLAGSASSSSIRNVDVSGVIVGEDNSVGGIVGYLASDCNLHDSSAWVEVSGSGSVGGAVGYSVANSRIARVMVQGAVSGSFQVGGFVGYADSVEIRDCYSLTSVMGTGSHVGGFVGRHLSGTITHGYSAGPVTGPPSDTGGFAGSSQSLSGIRRCYWDVEASGQTTSAGGEGRTTAQMRQQETYVGFNFAVVWEIEEGADTPSLRDLSALELPQPINLADLAGTGTPEDPYIITTVHELNAMRQSLSSHYRLGNDIDAAATLIWDDGAGWLPIGSFSGSLDGHGHSISNLFVRRPAGPGSQDAGLFGSANGAEVRNLSLVGIEVEGRVHAGGIAGLATASSLRNVHVSGVISGVDLNSVVGGIVGRLPGGSSIQDASAYVAVSGGHSAGGAVGSAMSDSVMARVGVHGSVSGRDTVGGLVGRAANNVLICDSFSQAAVFAEFPPVGGLVGAHNGGYIVYSYSAGPVISQMGNPGGFSGSSSATTNILQCYWDVETSGQTTSAGGAGRTTAEMQKQSTFPWFNFSAIWEIDEGEGYPTLREVTGTGSPEPVNLADLPGEGTEEDPYILTNVHELHAMRQDLKKHYRLGNDIDCAPAIAWHNGTGWLPIGVFVGPKFEGSLDGGGFTISNLVIRNPRQGHQGLFGYARGARIHNLRIVGADILGGWNCGVLAGTADRGFGVDELVIDNVDVQGNVFAQSLNAGGVFGASFGWKHNVSFHGNVRGGNYVGGIVGGSNDSGFSLHTILHAVVKGRVQGENFVGGIVGGSSLGSVIIQDSYSLASVNGLDYVGGIVGQSRGVSLHRCYSAAPVQGTGPRVGGLEGEIDHTDIAAHYTFNSYWDVDVSGQTESRKGTGRTTDEMMRQENFEHWNFNSLWQIEEGEAYPEFRDLRSYQPPIDLELADLQGAGTVDEPYIITNLHELNAVRKGMDQHYRLGNDIDMSASLVWNTGRGWTPIGSGPFVTSPDPFTGTLDGAGFAILYPAAPPFRYAASAVLKDLALIGINVSGALQSESGFVVTLSTLPDGPPGLMHNVYAEGFIFERRQLHQTGGLVGWLRDDAIVSNSVANVSIVGIDRLGGVVGYMLGGHLRNVASVGSIKGSRFLGGLCGYGQGSISNCYSRSSVDGFLGVGGLVGWFTQGEISKSYAAGGVHADHLGGGLVGRLDTGPYSVNEAYWDTQRTGQPSGSFGEPRTTAEMTFPYDPDTYENWDFVSVWTADTDGRNNGYPYLASVQIPTVTLSYDAGLGGSLIGPTTQTILVGADGAPVTTDPEPGAQFGRWSDGLGGAVRQDLGVGQNLSVTAFFKSEGGVDIDWYAGNGFFPGAGQTWADLDGLDPLNKGMTLLQDFVADTDPHDASSLFEIHDLDWTVGPRLHFRSSAARRYRLERRGDSDDGEWLPVPGAGPRRGVGGEDTMTDANATGGNVNYRLSVEVP